MPIMSREAFVVPAAAALLARAAWRTSSQTCSESMRIPSRSKTTASITRPRDVALAEVDERRRAPAALDREHLADEERVVARVVLVGEATLEPAEGVVEQRRARPRPRGVAIPCQCANGGHAAREVLGDRLLVAGEQAEREPAGFAEELVHGRLPADRRRRRAAARARARRAS